MAYMTQFRARKCLLGVSLQNLNLTFSPIFHKNMKNYNGAYGGKLDNALNWHNSAMYKIKS